MAKKNIDLTVEQSLKALYELQKVLSEVDRLQTLRGELPLEVQDLEDEVTGIKTRIERHIAEIGEKEAQIKAKTIAIEDAKVAITKYEGQQNNVRNNREFDMLSKEIEYQTLEVELAEKNIRSYKKELETLQANLETIKEQLEDTEAVLKSKSEELEAIVSETQADEEKLLVKSKKFEKGVEERLTNAFYRIRENEKNGLAVVTVSRNACGGCFNKIPPQRQLDIKTHKKIIVCEYCGRILVDETLDDL